MLQTIRTAFPANIGYTVPNGGLFTWLTFPEEFDAAHFMKEEALPRAKVAYVPGGTFFPVNQELNHARLSYATQPDEAIVRGITALGQLLSEHLGATV
jgi:DNA-binding transcriptional MocR family regulator